MISSLGSAITAAAGAVFLGQARRQFHVVRKWTHGSLGKYQLRVRCAAILGGFYSDLGLEILQIDCLFGWLDVFVACALHRYGRQLRLLRALNAVPRGHQRCCFRAQLLYLLLTFLAFSFDAL